MRVGALANIKTLLVLLRKRCTGGWPHMVSSSFNCHRERVTLQTKFCLKSAYIFGKLVQGQHEMFCLSLLLCLSCMTNFALSAGCGSNYKFVETNTHPIVLFHLFYLWFRFCKQCVAPWIFSLPEISHDHDRYKILGKTCWTVQSTWWEIDRTCRTLACHWNLHTAQYSTVLPAPYNLSRHNCSTACHRRT